MDSLDDRKRAARTRALAIMAGCDPACGQAVGRRIRPHVPAGAIVAGFHPLGRELDITPLLLALRASGHTVALPRTPARGRPLAFHRWADTDGLVTERFGTRTSDGPPVTPDLLLVPLLAFDRDGRRLGYGGGYYDRTIAALPAIRTIGCAYAALELPELPAGPHDAALQAIATETEFLTIKGPPCASFS